MPFRPNPNDELTISDQIYRVAEHPAAPGMSYGQTGRRGTVYQLLDENGEAWALKVFQRQFREPRLVGQAERIKEYATLPGLRICNRQVLTSRNDMDLLREHIDLAYAVLMPWVHGKTWMEISVEELPMAAEESLLYVRSLLEVLTVMEERGLAHCDLSGPNLILTSEDAIELVDLEEMFGPNLMRPKALPGGSPGYAHKTAPDGLWRDEADRYAGAVLIAEMLGWCDDEVREATWGEGYFDPSEMQTNCERFQLMKASLNQCWGSRISEFFEAAWFSDTLSMCPTFTEWLAALPEEVPEKAPESDGGLESSVESGDLSLLIMQAERASRQGDHEEALKLLKRVEKQARGALLKEVQERIAELECVNGALEIPESAERWQCEYCSRQVPIDLDRCPYCEVGIRSNEREEVKDEGIPSKDRQSLRVESFEELEIEPKKKITSSEGPPIMKSIEPIHEETPQELDEVRGVSSWIVVITIVVGILGIAGLGGLFRSKPIPAPTEAPPAETEMPSGDLDEEHVKATATQIVVEDYAGPLPDGAKARFGKGTIWDISLSPSGEFLVVGGGLGIFVYDTKTFDEIWYGNTHVEVSSVAWSPDGSSIATGMMDGTVMIWSVEKGKLERELQGHTDIVWSIAWSPDGEMVATGSWYEPMIIWDVDDWSIIHELYNDLGVECIAWSPDSNRIVGGLLNGEVIIWDVRTGKQSHALEVSDGNVLDIAWSPDGKKIAIGASRTPVSIWDGDTGEKLIELNGHRWGAGSVAWSPKGDLLASSSSEVIIWDMDTKSQKHSFEDLDSVNQLVWSPNGEVLTSVLDWSQVVQWDVLTGEKVQTLMGHTRYVADVNHLSLENAITTISGNTSIIYWGLESKLPMNKLRALDDFAQSVEWSPDGKMVAFGQGYPNDRVVIWEPGLNRIIHSLEMPDLVESLAWSPDGKKLAAGTQARPCHLVVWDIETGEKVDQLELPEWTIGKVAWSESGNMLAASTWKPDKIYLWDFDNKQVMERWQIEEDVYLPVFSPDGETLYSASSDDELILWDIDAARKKEIIKIGIGISEISVRSDGLIAIGSGEGDVLVLDPTTGEILEHWQGHNSSVKDFAWLQEERMLASGSHDGTVVLWDIKY